MNLPQSLYIHMPWCVRKCPYCDFNSHRQSGELPELAYVQALLDDLSCDLERFGSQGELQSIFIGGGTPSLFSAEAYERLLTEIGQLIPFSADIEITLEANPGSVEQERFSDYRMLGINRLSLGIQSFNSEKLKRLGRIHDGDDATGAIDVARQAGFDNLNLDLMYGLPEQTTSEALRDLKQAIQYQPEHLSWYQLTLEPNTVFYKKPPKTPSERIMIDIEQSGTSVLQKAGYQRYEISAFARDNKHCQHNVNYWLFGDYFGIGAGAHGKLTRDHKAIRTRKHRQPRDYLASDKAFIVEEKVLDQDALLFEFMLNTTRLEQVIEKGLFDARTGLDVSVLEPKLRLAEEKGFVRIHEHGWQVTEFGRRYTNNLQEIFLD